MIDYFIENFATKMLKLATMQYHTVFERFVNFTQISERFLNEKSMKLLWIIGFNNFIIECLLSLGFMEFFLYLLVLLLNL